MSGSSVTNEPGRPGTKCSSGGEESHAEQEMNGLEECEDAMTDEEGEGVGGEGEAGTADWYWSRPKKQTYCMSKRRTRSNTYAVPRLVQTLHDGRGRAHHHVSNKRSEDLWRRPIIAMDSCFLKPNFTANSQTIPDESVTGIAVKEDRHQNIMSSVVLKKGMEEPWASERVAGFINSLGHKEITLRSDAERETIAFISCS